MGASVFADAGPDRLLVPVLCGLAAVAALFVADAVVSGGSWLIRGRAAPQVRKAFLWFAGLICLVGAGVAGAHGEDATVLRVVAVGLLAAGARLLCTAAGAFTSDTDPVAGGGDDMATRTADRRQE